MEGSLAPTDGTAGVGAAPDTQPPDSQPPDTQPPDDEPTGETRDSPELRARIAALTVRDAQRLAGRLTSARRTRDPRQRRARMASLGRAVDAAEERVAARRASVPAVSYPEELPVSARREDIAAAIRDHQVVVVAGETGSGKTTQLPKICLELGLGVRGLIGHTQPRRIAARSVAERIAEELGTPLGATVGYKVRFTDQSSEDSLVTVMTDGILLAELANDRMLSRYDTIIIDEAHERSLNIDFILGYLRTLLPKRPDLKLVITSATIDPQRFAKHFDDAPVIEVSGRTYPVEVRYRPLDEGGDDDERDQVQAICDAVEELWTEGAGDVLVFLSGEREIRDSADALRALQLPGTEILPLYARLSSAEQHRVFQSHSGRRVVLATNVAETSLTVPGIRYVVDPGTARISRYSSRTKVQRLPIEAISQASANQRKGRCGRVAAGVCIRLYSEDDFLARPEYTDPEILRTSLASVILRMAALGLGEVADFPFVDPPDRRHVRDGIQLLEELGALHPAEADPRKRLTDVGRRIAQLPVDPRLARMILEADRNGCVREVMILAAALSIQDPRERPSEKQQAADDKHRRFADKDSDFAAYLNLWKYLQDEQKELSSSQFRRLCKTDFLNYQRVREWQDLFSQLRQLAKQVGVTMNSTPADSLRIHQSLLSGLLSHVGLRDADKRDYQGARGARFALFPGSALFRKPPQFVMAAELVETSRLWGRVAARIDPEWAEKLAPHLVKRSYSEPHWEKDRGAVMAYEKVLLYGVPLVAARKVSYAKVDPELCRDLFLRRALVEGDWRTHHAFWQHNQDLLADVEHLEHRARRRDIVVDDETLYAFYDERIPPHVVSARHFDAWWKKARHKTPDLLTFDPDMLVREEAVGNVDEHAYPSTWVQGDLVLPLSYEFTPGTDSDGVTVQIPVEVLNRIDVDDFAWQVPGLREELVTTLIRTLPKQVRVSFVPAPDHAREVLRRIEPRSGPLLDVLSRGLDEMTGVQVGPDEWDIERLPPHLRMRFRVVGDSGRILGESRDLTALRRKLAPKVRTTVAQAAAEIERQGLRSWDVGTLPRTYEHRSGKHLVRGFPALTDEGDSVSLRVLATQEEQQRAMRAAVRRLLLLEGTPSLKAVVGTLDNAARLALGTNPYGTVPALLDDCVLCAVDSVIDDAGGVPWDEPAYAAARDLARRELFDRTTDVVATAARVLAEARGVQQRLQGTSNLALLPALADVRDEVSRLVAPGFISHAGRRRLPDLVRYLRAAARRLDKLAAEHDRDRVRMAQVHRMQEAYDALLTRLPEQRRGDEDVRAIAWLIQELRVSLFAQTLGTPQPVSEQRILRAIDSIGP